MKGGCQVVWLALVLTADGGVISVMIGTDMQALIVWYPREMLILITGTAPPFSCVCTPALEILRFPKTIQPTATPQPRASNT